MEALFGNVLNISWQHVVMWAIGGILIFLAIKKDMEPALLLPMGRSWSIFPCLAQ